MKTGSAAADNNLLAPSVSLLSLAAVCVFGRVLDTSSRTQLVKNVHKKSLHLTPSWKEVKIGLFQEPRGKSSEAPWRLQSIKNSQNPLALLSSVKLLGTMEPLREMCDEVWWRSFSRWVRTCWTPGDDVC